MAEKGRYLRAMGLESYAPTKTDLTPEGALVWGASKVPAALGGRFADWVYVWAQKKWPNAKRGADFTGGVCVVIAAYGLQVLITKYQASYGGVVDKFTDGMIGRMSSVIWNLFSGLFDNDKKKRAPGDNAADYRNLPDAPSQQQAPSSAAPSAGAVPAAPTGTRASSTPSSTGPLLPDFANGVDGDRESVREVAGLLHHSPEFTQQLADQMFQTMRQDGVKIDDAGREAVVRSMRQAVQSFAGGNF